MAKLYDVLTNGDATVPQSQDHVLLGGLSKSVRPLCDDPHLKNKGVLIVDRCVNGSSMRTMRVTLKAI